MVYLDSGPWRSCMEHGPSGCLQAETHPHLPIAFGFRPLRLPGAGRTLATLVHPPLGRVLVFRFQRMGRLVRQALVGGTNELIPLGVTAKMLGLKALGANQFGLAMLNLVLVKRVVLDVVAQVMLFQKRLVLFTAIRGICGRLLREPSQDRLHLLHMRDETGGVPCPLMQGEADYELIFGIHLDVVRRFRPRLLRPPILLHPHAGRVRGRLGIATPSGQLVFLRLVLLLTGQTILF